MEGVWTWWGQGSGRLWEQEAKGENVPTPWGGGFGVYRPSPPATEELGVRIGGETGPKRRTVTRTGLNDGPWSPLGRAWLHTCCSRCWDTVGRWDHPGFELWRDVV